MLLSYVNFPDRQRTKVSLFTKSLDSRAKPGTSYLRRFVSDEPRFWHTFNTFALITKLHKRHRGPTFSQETLGKYIVPPISVEEVNEEVYNNLPED
eukprot:4796557-Pleurochrysis_carterae.AAC.1